MNERPVLSWLTGGLLLGAVLLFAVATSRPLGVSTQYVRAAGGIARAVDPAWCESNAYFREEGIAFGYAEALVVGIPLGAILAALVSRRLKVRDVPEPWLARFGPSHTLRFAGAALGGCLILFGARLAGGCTSGHVLSGVSQLAVSSLVFFATMFGTAVVLARLLYPAWEART